VMADYAGHSRCRRLADREAWLQPLVEPY